MVTYQGHLNLVEKPVRSILVQEGMWVGRVLIIKHGPSNYQWW